MSNNGSTHSNRLINQECSLHSLSNCRLCHYDGSFPLDIDNPIHQAIISNYLATSRRKNYRELFYGRIYERRHNKRRFVRRIRGQSKDKRRPTDADEILLLSAKDNHDFKTAPAPSQSLNIDTNQINTASESGTVQTISRKYNRALLDCKSAKTSSLPENIANTLTENESYSYVPGKSLIRTRLGITMPAGTPSTMTASVNYTCAGHSRDTYVSTAAGTAKFGVPITSHLPGRTKNSGSTSKARSTLTGATMPGCATDENLSVPGTKIANYSAQWLSIPSSSTSSSMPSAMNPTSSRIKSHQGTPHLMDTSDTCKAPLSTAALITGTKTSLPDAVMISPQAKGSTRVVSSIVRPLPSVQNISPSDAPYSRGGIIQKTPDISDNVFIRPTSRSESVRISHSLSDTLNTPAAVGRKRQSEETICLPPATCYKGPRCSKSCSPGVCHIIKCYSKKCHIRYNLGAISDGNSMKEQSLGKFSTARNFHQQQQNTNSAFPRRISLEEYLKLRMQTRKGTLFMQSSNSQNRIPWSVEMNSSEAESARTNRRTKDQADQSVIRPMVLISSKTEIEQSYGRKQVRETPLKIKAPPENTSLIGTNQQKLKSLGKVDSNSPDEVVESFLTRMMSSSNATTKNVVVSSQMPLAGCIPSLSARPDLIITRMLKKPPSDGSNETVTPVQRTGPTDSEGSQAQTKPILSRQLSLNWDVRPQINTVPFAGRKSITASAAPKIWNASKSSNTHVAEMEKAPLELHYLVTPNSAITTVANATPRTLPRGILPKSSVWNATTDLTTTSALSTPCSLRSLVSMAMSIKPATGETNNSEPAGMSTSTNHTVPIVPVNASSKGSLLAKELDLQPDQPLPPFESINGKFRSTIKQYWAKPDPPALLEENVSLSNEPNTCVQKICEWLLNSSPEPPLRFPMSTAGESAASAVPIAPAFRNDGITNTYFQILKQHTDSSPARLGNGRTCSRTPIRKFPPAKPKPKIIQGRVNKPFVSPYKKRNDDFIIVCEGKGFKMNSSVLEQASPVFKDFVNKCGEWFTINGQEYRVFEVLGITHWAMYELLKFISHHSYNHNVMRTSHMKGMLEKLKIKYEERKNFVFPVESHRWNFS